MLSLLLTACGSSGGGDVAATDVVSIRVDPTELSLTTRADAAATATFVAYATFEDGTEAPLELVSWDSSSTSAGTVDSAGLFTASSSNGGITTISATHAGITASADVTVVYAADYVSSDVEEAAVAAFESASPTEDDGLALRYPPDGVNLPRNLTGLGFLWDRPDGDFSRLHFRSELTDVSVYVAGDTWTSSNTLWSLISAANTSGEVEVVVEAGTWDGTTLSNVRRGPAITISVNRFDATGSVLYWDSSAQAIMRIPFGETTPERFWPVTADGTCVGCHALVDGIDRMVVTHDGIGGVFTVVDVSDPDAPQTLVSANNDHRMTFKALSPDGRYMFGALHGTLVLYDMETNAYTSSVDSGGYDVTHPDWSPDGDSLVMVRQTGTVYSDMSFSGGEIVQVDWDGDSLGTPEVLVPRESGYNFYYPTYSPDGNWIAYNRSTGDSYADEDAEIWLISRDGTIEVPLDAANTASGNQNSYPRWGPLPDDDVLWLAFSSDRGYALELTDTPQIWVSAIDPGLAEAGSDPSHAPFWLPGQATNSDNHLPVWWDK